jgi:hypothetical protein
MIMKPRLEAREASVSAETVAFGTGSLTPHALSAVANRWRQQIHGAASPPPGGLRSLVRIVKEPARG